MPELHWLGDADAKRIARRVPYLKDLASFSLSGVSSELAGFAKEESERPYLIDMDRGHLKIKQDESQIGLDLDQAAEGIRREDVIRELDRRVRRDDVLQADLIAWLGRALDGLVARGIELTYMARHLNQLAEAIAKTLKSLEQAQRNKAFQGALFGGTSKPSLSERFQFNFDPNVYPARWLRVQGRRLHDERRHQGKADHRQSLGVREQRKMPVRDGDRRQTGG